VRHIVLLRGINVGGHNKLPMAELREVCAGLGCADVRTYIQSGNVVCDVPAAAGRTLGRRLAAAIAARWGYDVPVIVRRADAWARVVAACPLAPIDVAAEGGRVFVMFLDAEPAAERVADLRARVTPPEELVVVGREVHLRCPAGYADTKLNGNTVERVLGVAATARNWKTVLKLHEMAG